MDGASARGVGERLSLAGSTNCPQGTESKLWRYIQGLELGKYLTAVGERSGMVLTSCTAQESPP